MRPWLGPCQRGFPGCSEGMDRRAPGQRACVRWHLLGAWGPERPMLPRTLWPPLSLLPMSPAPQGEHGPDRQLPGAVGASGGAAGACLQRGREGAFVPPRH